MNKLQLLDRLTDLRVAVPATGLAAAGASAYGNALAENEYQKGDNRMIAESLLSGLGAAAGAYAMHPLYKRVARNPRIQRMAGQIADSAELTAEQRSMLNKLAPTLGPRLLLGTSGAGLGAAAGAGAASLQSAWLSF